MGGRLKSSGGPGDSFSSTSSSTTAGAVPPTPSSSPSLALSTPREREPPQPYTLTSPFPLRLSEYTDATRIFESKHTVVYHATRVSDGVEVVLKLPNSRNPGRSRLLVFGQQFELLKSIEAQATATETEPGSGASQQSRGSSHASGVRDGAVSIGEGSVASTRSITPATQHSSLSQGVIRAYDLISVHNTLILVCEYFNGPSLHSYLSTAQYSNGFPLVEFLCVGIKLAHVLYDIHQQSIIHRDITSSNILYNRQTREIKVIDFGLAAIAPLGSVTGNKKITQLVGTMAYISPEQTGRVSRSIDYRTDLYTAQSTAHSPLHSTVLTMTFASLVAHSSLYVSVCV